MFYGIYFSQVVSKHGFFYITAMIARITRLSFTTFSREVLNSTPFHTHILNKLIAITYQHMSADELK